MLDQVRRTVEGDVRAAVVALDHPIRVGRVDPEILVVAVRRRDRREGLAAVNRLPALQVQNPDRVLVARVSEDMDVVPGAPPKIALLADSLPGVATVVRTEERAIFGLDQRPDAARLGRRDRDADLTERRRSAAPDCE